MKANKDHVERVDEEDWCDDKYDRDDDDRMTAALDLAAWWATPMRARSSRKSPVWAQ